MRSTTLIALSLLLALSACNTVRGVGQDLQAGGRALEGSSRSAR